MGAFKGAPGGGDVQITTDNCYPYWTCGTKQDSGAVAVASNGLFGEVTELD